MAAFEVATEGVIDDCDYYIVIVAGRYGSLGKDGISYTEMEYRYAIEKGKPVIAFLHKDPGKIKAERSEKDSDSQKKLLSFRDLAQKKVVKFWESPSDLGSKVSRSIVLLIQNTPAVGWIRSDQAIDDVSAKEILKLKHQIEELETKLAQARTAPPPGTEQFSQGEDSFKYDIAVAARPAGTYSSSTTWENVNSTWNELFAFISPLMIDELSEANFEKSVDSFAFARNLSRAKKKPSFSKLEITGIQMSHDDFQTIKVQLRALGLIMKSAKQRSIKIPAPSGL